jgi:hypothetical protein
MKKPVLVCLIAAASFACGDKKEATSVASTQATPAAASVTNADPPANHPAITAASTAQQAQVQTQAPALAQPPVAARVTGKIVDTMDAGGYTYLRLKTASGDEWAAVRQTPVKKGATVIVAVQMTAEKFQSNTLKRTFDKIYFGALDDGSAAAGNGLPPMMTSKGQQPASPTGAGAPPGMSSAMGGPMGSAQEHMAAPAAGNISVPKAEGADGKRIAEIWAARASLKDTTVAVRGKVTKFNSGIMGKNWLHIADGSGENDITVTTNDMAAVGDVVLVKGTVHLDRDFGAGYRYPVIIEEASVSK